MTGLMRSSQVLLGEHNTCFYESENVKHEILFSNLKAGSEKGCSLLYISSEEDTEHVKEHLLDFGLEEGHLGNLKIVKSYEWYTPDGVLDINRVLKQYRELVSESLDSGLKGIYVSADAADTFDYLSSNLEPYLKLEALFGRTFNFPAEAVCAYRLNQALLSSEVFLQLVQAHKKTITSAGPVSNQLGCFKTMIEVLNNIFGEHATKIIFSYMERRLGIVPDQIPNRIKDFQKTLEQIYSKDLANRIMDRISKEFMLNELHMLRGYR